MRSDLELLEAWRAGDRAAAGELFDRHAESVYRFFANKVDRDVEDLVQITLMACVKGRDRVVNGTHFRAYLFGAARNVLRTYLYKRGRMREDADLGISSIRDLGVGPSTLFAAHQEQRLLLKALRAIPVESQLLLELRYWEELSTEELALVFAVPAGTIKSRLSRARKRLERTLRELESAGALLESTRTNLDTWAAGLRDQVSRIVASR